MISFSSTDNHIKKDQCGQAFDNSSTKSERGTSSKSFASIHHRAMWWWPGTHDPILPHWCQPDVQVNLHLRKWTSSQACSERRPSEPRVQIHLLHPWKDHPQDSHHEKMEIVTLKLQPVRQPPQTEETRAGHSVHAENWAQQTSCPHVQQVPGWWVWDVPMQRTHHDYRTSTAALPATWCSEAGHVVRTNTPEGQATWRSWRGQLLSWGRQGVVSV